MADRVEALGRAMFGRNAADFTDDQEFLDRLFEDPGVRQFWMGEAQFVLDFIGGME